MTAKASEGVVVKDGKGVIAYFVSEDWYFCSHRLPLAVAAKDAGFTVYVITRVTDHGSIITEAGLHLIPIGLKRSSINPIAEFRVVRDLVRILRKIKPALIHNVALKPVIYGSIAARISKVPFTVNALAGLGYLFSSNAKRARLLRPFIKVLFRLLLERQGSRLILQNPDDVNEICGAGIVNRDRVRMIMGSGVDTAEFTAMPEPEGLPVVLLASRMLWDKGIGDFVDAAEFLRREGSGASFVLAGERDEANPASIPEATLIEWNNQGNVEWIGKQTDMPAVIGASHIVCLPSIREGVPKVLIEAASCARPLVATDAPGCREIVRDGVNGLLVPIGDMPALAQAIRTLLESRELRVRMGNAGRSLVKERFSLSQVIAETLDLYGTLMR